MGVYSPFRSSYALVGEFDFDSRYSLSTTEIKVLLAISKACFAKNWGSRTVALKLLQKALLCLTGKFTRPIKSAIVYLLR